MNDLFYSKDFCNTKKKNIYKKYIYIYQNKFVLIKNYMFLNHSMIPISNKETSYKASFISSLLWDCENKTEQATQKLV